MFSLMQPAPRYDDIIQLPRAVRFPIELLPPAGFDPERLETWPSVPGRLEHVDGKLLYMPPCSDEQQDTVADVVITLGAWVRAHPDFVLGTNEAGMRIGGATRAADAAIWKRSDVGAYAGKLRQCAPVLAVEVAGVDEPESWLLEKSRWYLGVGVQVIWILRPDTREVVVVTPNAEVRHGIGDRLPAHAALPDLAPEVAEFFVQLLSR